MRSMISPIRRSREYALELAVVGDGDEAQQGRKDDDGESPGIARDDLAGGLAFREGGVGVPKRPLAGLAAIREVRRADAWLRTSS